MKKSNKTIDNISFPTVTEEFVNCNILKIEVGTTGHKGGDSGHGGRTYLSLEDLASTDMNISYKPKDVNTNEAEKIEIWFGGDTELETFTQALRFAVAHLEKHCLFTPEQQELESDYDHACNNYLRAFCKMYDFDYSLNTLWESLGQVVAVCDYHFDFEVIRYCVDNEVSWQNLHEWYLNCEDAADLGLHTVSLPEWLNGNRGVSRDARDRIRKLHKELDDLIEQENGKFSKGGF